MKKPIRVAELPEATEHTSDIPLTNIHQYWMQHMKVPLSKDDEDLKNFPLDTHCGKLCMDIIDRARDLLAICDPHPHVVVPIRNATLCAVQIVCFG